ALSIFDHGGNDRLGAFFAANGVPASMGYQRYSTPAAEWFREAWIKSRTLDREVPEPPPGVARGPCTEGAAKAKQPAAAPPVDLLDMDAAASPAPAPAADLLDLGGGSAAGPAEADLLGVGAGATHRTSTPRPPTSSGSATWALLPRRLPAACWASTWRPQRRRCPPARRRRAACCSTWRPRRRRRRRWLPRPLQRRSPWRQAQRWQTARRRRTTTPSRSPCRSGRCERPWASRSRHAHDHKW
ncbi:unnamed protein product, partial [Prorocentrum cordatum]